MSLAIIIPYYNIIFFEKTLFSLACQSDKRFKVYIGDNNSPDDPSEIIGRYKQRLDISYKKFNNKRDPITLSQQFAQCVSLISNEEWFMILGDDDILDNDVVAKFYNNLPEIENKNIKVIKYATIVINKYNEVRSEIYTSCKIEKSTYLFVSKFKNITRSSLSEHIFKTSQYKKYNIPDYPLAWHSDDMMVLQYSDFGNIFCVSDSIVFIRVSDHSISGENIKYPKEKMEASTCFYSEILYRYNDKFKYQELKLIYQKLLSLSIFCYKPYNLLRQLKIGCVIFEVNYVKRTILGIKYPYQVTRNTLLNRAIPDFFIPTFCFYNNKSRISNEFINKTEFALSYIRLNNNNKNDIKKDLDEILKTSIENKDDILVLCFESHHFSHDYSKRKMLIQLYMANSLGTDILFCGGENPDFFCKINDELYWVNSVTNSSFIILFKKSFPLLLRSNFDDHISVAENISRLTSNKLIIYPFFSVIL